jgi:hypothetical protein
MKAKKIHLMLHYLLKMRLMLIVPQSRACHESNRLFNGKRYYLELEI